MKAYKISCRDDDHGQTVVFAETGNEARQHGNGDMCDCGYMGLAAHRDKTLDKYAETGVTWKQLVLFEGWWMHCQHCEKQIHSDTEDQVWNAQGSMAFCDESCMSKYAEYIEQIRAQPAIGVSRNERGEGK